MFIVGHTEVLQVLSEHIDPPNIPAKYGGGLQYNFGDMPRITPDVLEGWTWAEGVDKLPIGPVRWEEGEGGEMVCLAVGSENAVKRKKVVGRLDKKWRDTFYPPGQEAKSQEAQVSKDVEETAAIPTSSGPPVGEVVPA